jgi:hypothetical protein
VTVEARAVQRYYGTATVRTVRGAAFFGSFMILIVVGGSLLFAYRVSNDVREGS